jgi:hypothetical protein
MVAGLENRTYAVYAYFWVANGQGFRFGAAMTNNPAGSLPLHQVGSEGVTAAAVNDFTTAVKVTEADRTLYQVSLGTVTHTNIAVYIDDEANGGYASSCWFDGIGYALSAATTPASIVGGVSNGVMTVSWPATHEGWVLQSATNLVDGPWVDVSGSLTNTWLSFPMGEGSQSQEFFRLRYPIE